MGTAQSQLTPCLRPMPTTLRLLLLLMLGLLGLQSVGYAYDAPVSFVSGAQNIVADSPEIGAVTVESAAALLVNLNCEGATSDTQAETRSISNFVAAESGGADIALGFKNAGTQSFVNSYNDRVASDSDFADGNYITGGLERIKSDLEAVVPFGMAASVATPLTAFEKAPVAALLDSTAKPKRGQALPFYLDWRVVWEWFFGRCRANFVWNFPGRSTM